MVRRTDCYNHNVRKAVRKKRKEKNDEAYREKQAKKKNRFMEKKKCTETKVEMFPFFLLDGKKDHFLACVKGENSKKNKKIKQCS